MEKQLDYNFEVIAPCGTFWVGLRVKMTSEINSAAQKKKPIKV